MKTSAAQKSHQVKLENWFSAIDTTSDMDDGIGDIDDFEPPHASQSSKMPFALLSLRPLTVS